MQRQQRQRGRLGPELRAAMAPSARARKSAIAEFRQEAASRRSVVFQSQRMSYSCYLRISPPMPTLLDREAVSSYCFLAQNR